MAVIIFYCNKLECLEHQSSTSFLGKAGASVITLWESNIKVGSYLCTLASKGCSLSLERTHALFANFRLSWM